MSDEPVTPPVRSRSPAVAAVLSLGVPGLGQLYNRETAKGAVIVCMSLGVYGGILLATAGPPAFRSWLTVGLLALAYLCFWIPAVIDAHQQARGASAPLLSGERTWYVVLMLLTVGPMALPLLWGSPRFSRTAKIAWTVFVAALAVGGILVVTVIGPLVERQLGDLRQTLQTF